MQVDGTSAVLFGASKGIGRATAAELARRGCDVLLVARGERALGETEAWIRASAPGVEVRSAVCDATDEDAVRELVASHVERRGVPDYLFNLVGAAYPHYLEHLSLEDFRRAMDINYYGQLVPTLALMPHFLREGRGHVANVASVLGFMGLMGYATYAPTKYAVVGLTEALRHELRPRGIGFSLLFPPDTRTPGFDEENETKPPEWTATSAATLMEPERVARDLVDGVRRGRFYIMPGQAAWLWRLARYSPWLLHRITDSELARARARLTGGRLSEHD